MKRRVKYLPATRHYLIELASLTSLNDFGPRSIRLSVHELDTPALQLFGAPFGRVSMLELSAAVQRPDTWIETNQAGETVAAGGVI